MTIAAHRSTGDKDVATHLHSYTNLAALPHTPPLVIVEGDGIHVVDDRGNRYVEGMSGLWCASLGFSNARLAEAGAKALRTLPYYHTFNQRTNVAVADLAERLLALLHELFCPQLGRDRPHIAKGG